MANHVLLNNVDHKDLRVKADYSAEYGDSVASVLTFPSEFGDVHKEYPILFQKDASTGKFQSVVLLGFQKGENLFLSPNKTLGNIGWNASYVPGIVARGPFLIGFQDQSADGGDERAPVIHIDMDNPRVSTEEGERLFKEFGGNSAYLEKISVILQGLHHGMSFSDEMFTAFEHFELIEPVTINVQLNDGEKISIQGNYTISDEKLSQLSGEALEKLNRAGFLQGAFLVLSSFGNIKKLIELKNQKG